MPHDKNGTKIEAGDIVTLKARVKVVDNGVEFCNTTLEIIDDKNTGEHCPVIAINARLTEKAELVETK